LTDPFITQDYKLEVHISIFSCALGFELDTKYHNRTITKKFMTLYILYVYLICIYTGCLILKVASKYFFSKITIARCNMWIHRWIDRGGPMVFKIIRFKSKGFFLLGWFEKYCLRKCTDH